jgi:hypothetical protein
MHADPAATDRFGYGSLMRVKHMSDNFTKVKPKWFW